VRLTIPTTLTADRVRDEWGLPYPAVRAVPLRKADHRAPCDDEDLPTERPLLERRWVSVTIAVATFIVFMYAIAHENNACRGACYDISERPYESGHPWTAYQDSWQWQVQWLLGVGGFGAALAALATSSRARLRRWTLALEGPAVLLSAGWILWRALEPGLPSI
jgi:hypothetical protein